jgi:hypothetical protein
MSAARRIAAMEPLIESEQKLLRYNREILLSGVREVMVKLGKTEVEARRLYTMVCSPDEAALIADDWETNPQTLELLKKLNQPNGRRKLIEAGLQRSADAFGLCFEDWLCVLCLDAVPKCFPPSAIRITPQIVSIAHPIHNFNFFALPCGRIAVTA